MPLAIEDYGLIGNLRTAALVGRDGSMDWLCLPRFDSPACFAALLGSAEHGRWRIAPLGGGASSQRAYRKGTLVLETEFATPEGAVRIVDCMSLRKERTDIVRVVEGVRGDCELRMELAIRCEYGSVVPWVRRVGSRLVAVAGPDALELRAPVETHGENFVTVAQFRVAAGARLPFVLTYFPSHEAPPVPIDGIAVVEETTAWWRAWSQRTDRAGDWREAAARSLITLKALTYAPTGAIVAAPTTSLPEALGGPRNWDYRYCWLRDATFTLYALLSAGYTEEATAWREWLVRAAAGHPHNLQISHGLAGERRLPEFEVPWLPGYAGSRPVRIGNAASAQFQLDVYGEVMDTLHVARASAIESSDYSWRVQHAILDHLEGAWRQPDHSIWEIRAEPRHFTHSKVMAWVAADRAVKAVERFGLSGPADKWRALRAQIHAEVCARGVDAERGTFVQAYGSHALDASLLMIPLVGFLPAEDPRVRRTVEAIERELVVDGFVLRYRTETGVDGLPPGEGTFLPCSFWLVDNLVLLGRLREARALFDRLCAAANDLGLYAEEYDPRSRRLLGNFPQAFTHVGHVNSLCNLARPDGPGARRGHGAGTPARPSAEAPAPAATSAAGSA